MQQGHFPRELFPVVEFNVLTVRVFYVVAVVDIVVVAVVAFVDVHFAVVILTSAQK